MKIEKKCQVILSFIEIALDEEKFLTSQIKEKRENFGQLGWLERLDLGSNPISSLTLFHHLTTSNLGF